MSGAKWIKGPVAGIGIVICGVGIAGIVCCAGVAMTGATLVEMTDAIKD